METKRLRICAFLLLMNLGLNAVAQRDSIFLQGYINNVLDDDMILNISEDLGQTGIVKFDVGKNDGHLKDGFLDLIYPHRKSKTGYFILQYNMESNWSLMKTGFWASKGDTVRIEGDGYLNGTWRITSSSPEQKEQNLYQEACLAEIKAYQQTIWDYAKYRDWRRYAPDMEEQEWNKTVAHVELLEKRMDSLKVEWHKKMIEVMKERPVGNVWVRSFAEMARYAKPSLVKELKTLYKQNESELKKRPDAELLWSMLHHAPKAELGKMCVDREMYDLEGKVYRLADFRGKYVLVAFWSRGCVHCIANLPIMAEFQERHKDKLVMINLTTDEDEAWRTCKFNNRITWLNLSDGVSRYGLAKSYEIEALPTYVLISPEGKWIKKWRGSDDIFESGKLEQCIR